MPDATSEPTDSNAAPQRSLRDRAVRAVGALVWLYAAGVVVAWILLRFLADRIWPATLLAFAPRWVLALPLVAFAPLAAVMRRPKWLIVLAVAAVLVFGPVMGLCIAMPGSSSSNGPAVRVLTQNMGELKLEDPRLWNLIADVRPDIVFLQECGAKTYPPVSLDPAYHLHVDHNTCLLTKYPILKVDSRDRTDVWKKNGSGAITLYELQHPSRTIAAFNLHLETIREALESLRWKRFGGISDLKANLEERRWESELAHDWARHTTAPLVIGGDFNMPVESAIYRDYWSDFTNAFSKVGMGYGRTKQTRLFGMRIDHILTGPGWSIEAAWVVPDIGSDHRGMAAIVHLD